MAPIVPFGQYVAGNSLVHRLDARMKLLVVTSYVFALFAASTWLGLGLAAAFFVAIYLLSAVPPRLLLRGFKPILILLAFTFLANTLTFGASPSGESVALIGSFGIKPLGALRGLYFALRILLLVAMTSLLTYTTPVVTLSDSLVALMRPLARLRVPTEDIAMMFSIALRFIPITAEEAEKIMVAQSARGAVFDKGGPIRRARAWLPVMVPLFVSLFRRADELASAMETRCYVGRGRTQLRTLNLRARDLAIGCTLAPALIALAILL
ncbi:MAG: energy-coupling factor transporter transmembrane protein EcfT [Coriobacteriales bacterium]|jgi:energy-coupling factor transport system permease protein|nr:energy-coupling factor transporter transmembrane protein EcfT [Coriobacteriales bacterium]